MAPLLDGHGNGQQTRQHGERIEKRKKAASVIGLHVPAEMKGNSQEHVSHGRPVNEHGDEAAHKKAPVPDIAPTCRGQLAQLYKMLWLWNLTRDLNIAPEHRKSA